MKSKTITGILALFLGVFGVHRFYLGQRGMGILYFALFFITMMVSVEENTPIALGLPFLLGFIDAILFLVMPNEEFDAKFNTSNYALRAKREEHRFRREQQRHDMPRFRRHMRRLPEPKPSSNRDPHLREGIELFRSYDFPGAIRAFQRSLNKNYESASTHFNLACSYSMLEQAEDAYFHLEKAVKFGFDDFNRIDRHNSLQFLRQDEEFERFVRNGYQRNYPLPIPQQQEDDREMPQHMQLQPQPEEQNDLLDQLMQLGELREKGLLSEEEFERRKQRLLDHGE